MYILKYILKYIWIYLGAEAFLHVSVAVTLKIKQRDELRNFYKRMGHRSQSREIWSKSKRSLQDHQDQITALVEEQHIKRIRIRYLLIRRKRFLTHWNSISNLNILTQILFSFKLQMFLCQRKVIFKTGLF